MKRQTQSRIWGIRWKAGCIWFLTCFLSAIANSHCSQVREIKENSLWRVTPGFEVEDSPSSTSFSTQSQWSHQNETKNVVPWSFKEKILAITIDKDKVYSNLQSVGCSCLFVPTHSSDDLFMKHRSVINRKVKEQLTVHQCQISSFWNC